VLCRETKGASDKVVCEHILDTTPDENGVEGAIGAF